jgi:hypothetical protein
VPSSIFSSKLLAAWPSRVALTTAAILITYNLAVALVKPDAVLFYDSGLRNVIVAEHYLDGATPHAVLTGSSMGFRLAADFTEGDYLGPEIFNLSLAGKTALPGLDLILAKPKRPRIVFVEMNTMERSYDGSFAADRLREPWNALRPYLPGFRLENRPLDLAIGLARKALKSVLARAGITASERTYSAPAGLPEGPPINDRLRAAIAENTQVLERRIAEFRSAGIRIVLLRLPTDPAAETPATRFMWETCYSRFAPSRYEWIDLRSTGSYQTDDGIHLNRSSARLAASVLRAWVEREMPN